MGQRVRRNVGVVSDEGRGAGGATSEQRGARRQAEKSTSESFLWAKAVRSSFVERTEGDRDQQREKKGSIANPGKNLKGNPT